MSEGPALLLSPSPAECRTRNTEKRQSLKRDCRFFSSNSLHISTSGVIGASPKMFPKVRSPFRCSQLKGAAAIRTYPRRIGCILLFLSRPWCCFGIDICDMVCFLCFTDLCKRQQFQIYTVYFIRCQHSRSHLCICAHSRKQVISLNHMMPPTRQCNSLQCTALTKNNIGI